MQYEVYVAFSIHGTRAFITANKKVKFHTRPKVNSNVHVDGLDFKVGNSRTVSLRDGIKLLSKELESRQAPGEPTDDPQQVIDFFARLEGLGWSVIDEPFRVKHSLPVIKRKSRSKKDNPILDTDSTNIFDAHRVQRALIKAGASISGVEAYNPESPNNAGIHPLIMAHFNGYV